LQALQLAFAASRHKVSPPDLLLMRLLLFIVRN